MGDVLFMTIEQKRDRLEKRIRAAFAGRDIGMSTLDFAAHSISRGAVLEAESFGIIERRGGCDWYRLAPPIPMIELDDAICEAISACLGCDEVGVQNCRYHKWSGWRS